MAHTASDMEQVNRPATLSPAMQAAKDFFYPANNWCGYDPFFNPPLSGRLGDRLVGCVYRALCENNIEALNDAIDLLKNNQRKWAAPFGQAPGEVVCRPTEDGKRAVKILTDVLDERLGQNYAGAIADLHPIPVRPKQAGDSRQALRAKFIAERMMKTPETIRVVPLGSFSPHKEGFEGKYCPLPEYGLALIQE